VVYWGVHAGTRRVPSSDFCKQRVPSVRCVFTIGPLVGISRRVPSKVFSNTPLGVAIDLVVVIDGVLSNVINNRNVVNNLSN
jgi:hypothetical protein